MRQIAYTSNAAKGLTKTDLKNILSVAQRNNERDQLTGALYLKNRQFIQILEGPDVAVSSVLSRIVADDRHADVTVRVNREIKERTFGNWSMMLIGDEPEINRIASWFWPAGKIRACCV
ncbi:MAG: BLUF domain-containing protein [Rhodospirillales bacterium]